MNEQFPGEKSRVYGPATPQIRRFLMTLAGLGSAARADVVRRHASLMDTPAFRAAETALGLTIERAGRTEARDAVAGPLLQLVRTTDATSDPDDALAMLSPVAEPALAALLALLVADVLSPETVATLYAPFADVLPLASLGLGGQRESRDDGLER